jgi:hypothetical protein
MYLRPDRIPLIHNYCDYWCDRCAFTSRCAVYADKEREEREERLHTDGDNATLWRSVESALNESLAQLHELRLQAIDDWLGDVDDDFNDEEFGHRTPRAVCARVHPPRLR